MSKNREKMVNAYAVLGVSDERADEMSTELQKLRGEAQDTTDLLTLLAKQYDPESVVMGLYLAIHILEQERRLLPQGAQIVGTVELPAPDCDPTRN
jgi:hypothetical protein